MIRYHRRAPDSALRRGRPLTALAVIIGCAVLCIVTADALAAGAVPRAPGDLGASAANKGLKVEPATMIYTGDGTGLLGGASVRRHSSIHWTKWTAGVALGTGFDQVNYCVPSCAGGAFHGYGVRIELWRPQTLHGTLVFTRMTIFYVRSRPRGEPQHYTFTDIYVGRPGGFGWGPPSAGYCARIGSQTPATGCNNIHSLP